MNQSTEVQNPDGSVTSYAPGQGPVWRYIIHSTPHTTVQLPKPYRSPGLYKGRLLLEAAHWHSLGYRVQIERPDGELREYFPGMTLPYA